MTKTEDIYIKNTTKVSYTRAFLYGRKMELIEYQKPFFYNRMAFAKSPSWSDTPALKRRDDNIGRTRRSLRRIVEANAFEWGEKPKFITFTFAENIQDLTLAHKSWVLFKKRLKYIFGFIPEYVAVPEFQKRGAIHYHVVFFNLPYTENIYDVFSKIWAYGFVNIKTVYNALHLSRYLTKYLSKSTDDKRLVRRRAFYTSAKLKRPLELKDISSLHDYVNFDTIILLDTYSYLDEKYGLVKYKYYEDYNKSIGSFSK